VLADQADLSQAAALQTKAEKGRYVYNTLLNKSLATQGPLLQWLRERGLEHQSFYIVNAILVKGTRDVAETLAARPEVARVEGNPHIQNHFPQPEAVDEAPPSLQRPATIEPGINYVHAPQVWALGFTGQNIVVASADTGVRWTHNALKPHYRGWDGMVADHDYNWHDSIHTGGGFAVLTRLSHAMIALMVRTPPVRWSVMTARVTRSVWRPVQSGLVAATWIKATARPPDTSSACNGSWRPAETTFRKPGTPRILVMPALGGSDYRRHPVAPGTIACTRCIGRACRCLDPCCGNQSTLHRAPYRSGYPRRHHRPSYRWCANHERYHRMGKASQDRKRHRSMYGVVPIVIMIGNHAVPTTVMRLKRVMRPAHASVRARHHNVLSGKTNAHTWEHARN